jgi:translocation and assembly module TamB
LRRRSSASPTRSIRIERAEIAAGGGRVIVAGTLAPALEASIEVSDLQLAMAPTSCPMCSGGPGVGHATLSGSLEAPQARFVLTGRDVSVAALRDYGLPPLALEVQGDFAEQNLTFLSTARGPAPTELAIAGTVSLGEPAPGRRDGARPVPSTLASDELAEAGLRLDAVLEVDLRLAGPLDNIAITGAVTTANATFGDAEGASSCATPAAASCWPTALRASSSCRAPPAGTARHRSPARSPPPPRTRPTSPSSWNAAPTATARCW